ncbi:hypothetical protein [Mucilaginibacter sp. AK015]|uniref:hypothetical protein n=1 Tax=Mucilaginibacter sp. AK015 TaxID=2723072 RepID=UPI001615FADD|nr:hypothetical protein [Mucilaginibacter sp. AK015]MBB5394750.1 ABC-type phosphate/phosphonate transport system permease subunit [Mucilaginibacter sp. AK015]
MNQAAKTALSAIGGTSVMTLSSHLMSEIFGENFREPQHLATMIGRLAPALSKNAKQIAGWGAHFAMGFVFAAVYVELWETRKIKHTILNGVILGLVSGVLGFLIWKGTFKAHPLPPLMRFDHYYLQRIPAHVVFAVFATITYRLIKSNEESSSVTDEPAV